MVVFGFLQQTEDPVVKGKVFQRNYKRFLDRIDAWQKYEAQKKLGKLILLIEKLYKTYMLCKFILCH
jgi:hypothetical protein